MRSLGALAAGLLVLVAAPGTARAGVSAQASPEYTSSEVRTRDETGRDSRVDVEQWLQRYRLDFDNQLFPLLSVAGGGNLNWTTSDARADGVPQSLDNRIWTAYGRLSLGERTLSGGLDYVRRWEDNESRIAGVKTSLPQRVREAYGASASWRPADLPSLTLRVSRSNSYDADHTTIDQTTDDALLSAAYSPEPSLDLRYTTRYSSATDRLTDVVRSELTNSGLAAWHDKFLGGRGNAYVSYGLTARTTDTSAPRAGTSVPKLQLPIAGLSLVETLLQTPDRVTLNTNAQLVDGDLETRAGVNLGTSASTGGGASDPYRDMGAQFQDVVTPVNEIHVWVDRQLPGALAGQITWRVYRSDNNLDWVPVAVIGPVVFNPVVFRFEVPIERTSARYLKVVTKPLPTTATNDPQFAEIFVTELQFFDVIPAEQARGRTSELAGTLNGTTRIVLVPDLGLAYDFTGLLAHTTERSPTWSMINGLSLSRKLSRVVGIATRVDRTDSDLGVGHQALNRWSASLSADPIPTLGALVGYSGQLAQLPAGNAITHTGTASARAELYQGLSLTSSASFALGRTELGADTRSTLVSAAASIVPNRIIALSGGASYTESVQRGGGQPEARDSRGLLESSASLTLFPALSLSATVARQVGRTVRGTTLYSFSGAFSPFAGGDLQLRYTYAENYDTGADQRTRSHGPSATWKIRSGWFARAGYVFQDSTTPSETQHARTFNASVLITFR